jgi:hypothetical protein
VVADGKKDGNQGPPAADGGVETAAKVNLPRTLIFVGTKRQVIFA